ncbi:hypothetical protein [Selenomonas ruminantium]|uniref:Helix-turn-helix domain-containing protein n=1 Tax=Selenomonas ruminantium TaxID=971 RepID=A0A1K1MLB7_SELRU|nr:hypothetical protein [Selenomonas ruminantium]SFW23875.1 hypothetical protein SAMN02910323_0930 [Selenomonas ruminantium]
MTIDELSRKAVILYGYIQGSGGGALDEWQMRDKTGLSHGTICAARKELVDAGLLTLGKDGRRTIYILTSQSDRSADTQPEPEEMTETAPAEPAARVKRTAHVDVPPPPAPKAVRMKKAATPAVQAVSEAVMPRVAGEFNSFDEWLSTLTMELGGCVNVSESLITPHEYIVCSDEYDMEDRYTVTENEDGSIEAR